MKTYAKNQMMLRETDIDRFEMVNLQKILEKNNKLDKFSALFSFMKTKLI